MRPPVERLKLLTLNIWNRQGPWPARLAAIRAGIAALDPDIIGLQEVLRSDDAPDDQAAEIAAGLGYEHRAFGSAWHIGGPLHLGNAVLSRWPIAASESWPLPSADGKEGHGLLHARVDAPCGAVPVFVTHFAWRLHHGHIRIAQVQFVTARIKERAPLDDFPPILMGDLNAEPDSDEMRYLRGLTPLGGASFYLADVWTHRGDGVGHTWSAANPYANRTREGSRRIDYIYVRGPDRKLRGEPLAARVVLDRPTDGVWPSDHFGVYAEIQAAPRRLDPL
jgi:endonuclease/exonuclease/phosphatase family metal-dependent hydrolase